jgi:hypothetical protein
VIVPVGRDPVTKRYRYAYRQAATREEAEELRDEMLADLAKGRQPRREATFGQLLDAVLEVADLDVNTRVLPPRRGAHSRHDAARPRTAPSHSRGNVARVHCGCPR